MIKPLGNLGGFTHKLLRWRWWIVAGISLSTFLLEVYEHRPINIGSLEKSFLGEVFLYTLVLPPIFGVWLSLVSSNSRIIRTVSRLDLQQEIRQQFTYARSWEEMATILLQAPRAILPVSSNALTLLDETTGRDRLTRKWSADGHLLPEILPSPDSAECPLGQKVILSSARRFSLCSCAAKLEASRGNQVYCMPLTYSGRLQGWMHLCVPSRMPLQEDQVKRMEGLGFEMSQATENYKLRCWYESHSKNIEAERQRLARSLHDTIAHDLAYLHLKLDQFSSDSASSGPTTLREELGRLNDIVQRSYDQVRSSLSELQDEPTKPLMTGVRECIDTVADRSPLKIELTVTGEEKTFPPHVARQILLVFREALRNVEKHANAQQVNVCLDWGREFLEIQIRDDGQGFEPAVMPSIDRGYGLRFIQEAVKELDGRFTISSSKPGGTQLNFSFPME